MKESHLRYIKGVGPRKEVLLNEAGVYTIKDLLYYFPFRYEDRRDFKKISEVKAGQVVVIKGVVQAKNLKRFPYFLRSRKVRSVFEIILEDETGTLYCSWFNQVYLSDAIKVGTKIVVYGKVYSRKGAGLQIVSPEYEFVAKGQYQNVGKIISVYRSANVLGQKFMRKIISLILKEQCLNYVDPLPFYIRKDKGFLNIVKSFEQIHFPISWESAENARERFIFEELFLSQVLVYLRKAKRSSQPGIKFTIKKEVLDRIRKNLSFELTPSQEQSLLHILSDFNKTFPMHRLLQGDVGCGKTVVAALAIGVCLDCNYQAALMVPTEVLAHQHKETLTKILKGVSKFNTKGAIRVISSSLSKQEIKDIYRDLENGKIKVIVGTHSLIQEGVKFNKLGLVIIDEQHRFGVAQRSLLPKKGKVSPHCLVMSATPIPRSLALSMYGDLDISVIKDMPRGRIAPKTIWVKEQQRNWVYNFLNKSLKSGRQAYIVYPVIEENQVEDLKSLKSMYGKIKKRIPNFKVKMFHGQMKSKEKIKVINEFRTKKIDVLIATTVIEVGIGIENATVMVVENPERFGLAQLHQLRGRIQRSLYQPHFILISGKNLTEEALRRLDIISQENSGFKIAEEDLKLRGPGDFFGRLQHGLPDLKIANPLRDLEILNQARSLAYNVVKRDPTLEQIQHRCIRDHLDIKPLVNN